jgi:zinc/manganese transport system substrate-binding protein
MLRQLLAACVTIVSIVLPAQAGDRLNVVASFSILGDFARNVGGDRVNVTTLVGPNHDPHVYEPTPSDAKKIADAKVVIINGLGLEGWMSRLVQSSGSRAVVVVASTNVTPLKLGSGVDPHAWQTVTNAKTYLYNIRTALSAVAPADAEFFKANADAYRMKLDDLDSEIGQWVGSIPPEHRKVISTHTAFGYFAKAYGIKFIAPRGVSTDSEPSARDIAGIITQIKTERIPVVFLENISDPRLIQRIAAETGARIGGTLYSDSLTDEKGEAPTYIDMVRHNIRALRNGIGYGPAQVR